MQHLESSHHLLKHEHFKFSITKYSVVCISRQAEYQTDHVEGVPISYVLSLGESRLRFYSPQSCCNAKTED